MQEIHVVESEGRGRCVCGKRGGGGGGGGGVIRPVGHTDTGLTCLKKIKNSKMKKASSPKISAPLQAAALQEAK